MRASIFVVGALLPFSLASAIQRRTAAAIVSGISTIISDISSLNGTVNSLNGTAPLAIVTAAVIQLQDSSLATDVNNTYYTAMGTPPLSSSESTSVANAVLRLEPSIFSLLDNLVANAPSFKTVIPVIGDASALVVADLQQQQMLAGQLGGAIANIIAEPYADAAPIINQQISDKFSQTIAVFQAQ